RGEAEEEHHADVVDGKLQRIRERAIAGAAGVCPHQRDDGADGQRERMLDEEREPARADQAFLRVSPSSASMVVRRDYRMPGMPTRFCVAILTIALART